MADVQGIVDRITARPQGRGQAYSVQIQGEWYGHGFDQPKFQEGQEVSFNISWNGQYKNVDVGSVVVMGGQQQQGGYNNQRPKQNYQSRQKSGGNGGKDAYWTKKAEDDKERQITIEHQSSRNAAIELIDVALREGAVKLPAKQAEKFDALVALVDELTYKFNSDLHGGAKEPAQQEEGNYNQGYQPPHQEGGYQE